MKKAAIVQEKKNDFQTAKDIVADLKLHKDVVFECESKVNFRKYLSDVAKLAGKKFITRAEGNKITITRLK